jgi:hypothetical protein
MKKLASVEVIQTEIQRRIRESTWARGYCADCAAPIPYRIPHDGTANWSANVGATAKRGCEGFLLEMVASVRGEYDLEPESLARLIERLLRDPRQTR